MKITSPLFKPHPMHDEVLADNTRFHVVCAGRRTGKGNLALREAVKVALNVPGSHIWFISPTYKATEPQWEKALQAFKSMRIGNTPIMLKPKIKAMRIPFFNRSVLDFKSADNPVSLLGAGDLIHFVIMDEAAYTQHAAWKKVRPILMDNKARASFFSTPNSKEPKNWFYDVWVAGQDTLTATCTECGGDGCEACGFTGIMDVPNPNKDPEYKSWRFSTYDNPYIDDAEVDALIREEMGHGWTELDVRREIYGEFVGGETNTFSLEVVRDCVAGTYEKYDPQYSYLIGIDLGRAESFTAIAVLKIPNNDTDTPHIVRLDRFQGDWSLQVQKIGQVVQSYGGARTLVDATGLGDPLKSQLRKAGVRRMVPIKLSGINKPEIIEALIAGVQSRGITWPDNRQLESELLNLEMKVTSSGQVQYRHARGYTDDMVIAVAFAWWGYITLAGPHRPGMWMRPIG